MGFLLTLVEGMRDGWMEKTDVALYGTLIILDSLLVTYYGLFAAMRSLQPVDIDHKVDVERSILELVKSTASRSKHFEERANSLCYLLLFLLIVALTVISLPLINRVPYFGSNTLLHTISIAAGSMSLACNAINWLFLTLVFVCHVECVKFRLNELTTDVQKRVVGAFVGGLMIIHT